MADIRPVEVSVVTVLAKPSSLDALAAAHRIAPDEAMLVGATETDAGIEDPSALVVETTDGWAAFDLTGDDARDAFARLSHLELPDDGFVQGDVAHIPAKVIVTGRAVRILVPAYWAHYLHERFLEVGTTETPA